MKKLMGASFIAILSLAHCGPETPRRATAGNAHEFKDSTALPNPVLTPGVSRTLDAREICGAGTAQLRHWTRERDNHILRLYNLPEGPHPAYEIDHLIPLGIGGADNDANLWPQPRAVVASQESAEKKDRLEYRMRDLICNARPQATAQLVKELQDAMAGDWIKAYDRYMPH